MFMCGVVCGARGHFAKWVAEETMGFRVLTWAVQEPFWQAVKQSLPQSCGVQPKSRRATRPRRSNPARRHLPTHSSGPTSPSALCECSPGPAKPFRLPVSLSALALCCRRPDVCHQGRGGSWRGVVSALCFLPPRCAQVTLKPRRSVRRQDI